MKCFYCHQEIDKDSKFCPFCGKQQSLACPNCGTQVSPGQAYCSGCGTKLGFGQGAAVEKRERIVDTVAPKMEEEPGKSHSHPRVERQQELMQAAVGVGRRFFALLIDTIILYAFNYYYAVSYGTASRKLSGATVNINFSLQGWPAFVTAVINICYFLLLEAILGATLGKLILGLRVVREDGSRIGFGASFVRNFLRIVDLVPFFIPYLLGAIMIWKSPAKQRYGDKVAKTLVVRAGALKQISR